jgi:hypothetical protein
VASNSFNPPESEWLTLYSKPVYTSAANKKGSFDITSTFMDVKDTFLGGIILKAMKKNQREVLDSGDDINDIADSMVMEMPLRAIANMSNGAMTPKMAEAFVHMFNGHILKGLGRLLRKD